MNQLLISFTNFYLLHSCSLIFSFYAPIENLKYMTFSQLLETNIVSLISVIVILSTIYRVSLIIIYIKYLKCFSPFVFQNPNFRRYLDKKEQHKFHVAQIAQFIMVDFVLSYFDEEIKMFISCFHLQFESQIPRIHPNPISAKQMRINPSSLVQGHFAKSQLKNANFPPD